ncbi:MAG: hypothetical protein K2Q09_05375 [Phycisphaerales bacterium]|nr:hypothetical protein [Phycisphaerales bacterium]
MRLPQFAQVTGKQVGWTPAVGLRFDAVDDPPWTPDPSVPRDAVLAFAPADTGRELLPAVMRFGWPMHAWEAWYAQTRGITATPIQTPEAHAAVPALGIPLWYTHDASPASVAHVRRLLPVVPRPLGVLVDAAAWAVPYTGLAFAWQRWRPRRAGRCTGCGYPLAGLTPRSPCPECGRARMPCSQRPIHTTGAARSRSKTGWWLRPRLSRRG